MFSELEEIIGEEYITHDPTTLKDFTIDGKVPKMIVYPADKEEISQIIKLANREGWAIIPWGGGSKMGLGAIPEKVDIVLCLSRLNRIIDLDLGNLHLTAQAGITLDETQKTLASKGKGHFIRLDPPFSTSATLGGIVATNSSGPKRFLYGSVRDMILGIGFVAPNGDIIRAGGKTAKNVSGYDINKLIIGSLGTLGIVTEVTFKFLPLPEENATLLVIFSELGDISEFISTLINSNLFPASIEILNTTTVNELSIDVTDKGGYTVAIGIEGVKEAVNRQLKDIEELGKGNQAIEVRSLSGEDHVNLWKSVEDFPKRVADRYPYEVACKSNFLISKSTEMIKIWEDSAINMGLNCAIISRAGSGILYSYILIKDNLKEKLDILVNHLEAMTEEAVKREGNLVTEFAPLPLKERIAVWGKSRNDFKIMEELKRQIDPVGILNPGRFVGRI